LTMFYGPPFPGPSPLHTLPFSSALHSPRPRRSEITSRSWPDTLPTDPRPISPFVKEPLHPRGRKQLRRALRIKRDALDPQAPAKHRFLKELNSWSSEKRVLWNGIERGAYLRKKAHGAHV